MWKSDINCFKPIRWLQINVDVEREVLNHRQLAHPFIIKFKKVLRAPWCRLHVNVDIR